MDQPLTTIISRRLRARARRLINKIRSLKFRQWMGLVLILRTFNPIIIPLGLFLIFYFFVVDLGRNPVIVASRAQIESGTAAVRQDVAELQGAVDDIAEDFRALGQILEPIVEFVKDVFGVINDVLSFVDPFNLLGRIDLGDIPGIPDFGLTFGLFSSIRDAVVGSLQALGDAYDQLVLTFAKWWRVLRFFIFFTVLWLALSYFSGFYMSIARGLDLLRGRPGAPDQDDRKPRTWEGRPVFETPPILVIDRAPVTVPMVQTEQPARKGRQQQRILRRRRVLLSAQAVWPDRHIDLYHYELAVQADEQAWARFWDRLISRGLDPGAVQLVLSPETRVLDAVTKTYLPEATVQRAVQSTVVSG